MKICRRYRRKKKEKKILKAFSRSIRVKHGRVVFPRITMTRSRTDGVADTVPQAAREVTPGITAITCIQTIWWVDQHKFDHRTWHFETPPIYSLQCHWKIWSHSKVREFADMQHIIPLTWLDLNKLILQSKTRYITYLSICKFDEEDINSSLRDKFSRVRGDSLIYIICILRLDISKF